MSIAWNDQYMDGLYEHAEFIACKPVLKNDVRLENISPKDPARLKAHAKLLWEKFLNSRVGGFNEDEDERMNAFVEGMPAHEKSRPAQPIWQGKTFPQGAQADISVPTAKGDVLVCFIPIIMMCLCVFFGVVLVFLLC